MAIRMPRIINAKKILAQSLLTSGHVTWTPTDLRKGCCAVYVRQRQKKQFVIPISYLNRPLFQDLLSKSEEEFGFEHPMGGLTIPCSEDVFIDRISFLD